MNSKLTILQPMRYIWLYFAISLAIIIPGTYSLIRYGLSPSIDFTGGTTIVWQLDASEADLRAGFASQGITLKNLTHQDQIYSLRTDPLDPSQYQQLKSTFPTAIELSLDTVGPSLGSELVRKTFYAIILATILIMLYVAYRFRNLKFGISAILAMLHDTLVLLGVFSLLGHFQGVEVDTLFVTAVLTILSFSVHDTIVVYDRIRELSRHHGYLDFVEIVNRAVVETMGRSLNNSLTIIFMLLAMYLLGGETTKWFILALLVGTISGTYSSTFTAAPLLVLWDRITKKRSGLA